MKIVLGARLFRQLGSSANAYSTAFNGSTYLWADPVLNAARYPQGLIINPVGNTNPDNAYYEYFSASLNGENNCWGGYVFGSNELTQIPPESTQNAWSSGGDVWRVIPSAHHVTQLGVAWTVAESSWFDGEEYFYTGNLIMDRGEIVDGEIVYTEVLYEFLEEGENFNDIQYGFPC